MERRDILNRKFITRIYESNYNMLYCLIKRWIYPPNPEDIEDIIHEVFIVAMKNDELEKHKNITGWLIKTTKNITLQFNEKKSQEMKRFLPIYEDLEDAIDLESQIIENLELKRMVSKDIISRVLGQLNDSEYKFYKLKYIHKLSYEDICMILGISCGTARARNSRIISKIKRLIKEYNE